MQLDAPDPADPGWSDAHDTADDGEADDSGDDPAERWSGAHSSDLSLPDRADQGEVRRNNLELVLRQVWSRRDSRAGIAGRTGLTRATVSRLVSELMDSGLVREDGLYATGQNGRPGTALIMDGRHVLGVGAEVNVDHLSVVVTDLSGQTVGHSRVVFPTGQAPAAETIRELARLCLAAIEGVTASLPVEGADAIQHRPVIVGVAVGVAGIVDVAGGVVTYGPNLNWFDQSLVGPLAAALDLPSVSVQIGNDANCAALAEVRFGEYAGATDIVYVGGDVGLGGGIISAGQSLLGRRGHGGEVGHITLEVNGPVCGCGRRGCWEAFVGLNAVLRAAGLRRADPPTVGTDDKISILLDAAERGDERTVAALAEAGTWLGIGAATLANVLNPQAVILGGYFVPLSRWLMPTAQAAFEHRAFGPPHHISELAVSQLGPFAVSRGAAYAMIEAILSDPTTLSEGEANDAEADDGQADDGQADDLEVRADAS